MTYNIELLKKVYAWATTGHLHTEMDLRFTQWAVQREGTVVAACLGGRAVWEAGGKFIWVLDRNTGIMSALECDIFDQRMPTSEGARLALGLTEGEAWVLFDLNEEAEEGEEGDRSMDFLKEIHDRALRGASNMTEGEVESWCNKWEHERYDEARRRAFQCH